MGTKHLRRDDMTTIGYLLAIRLFVESFTYPLNTSYATESVLRVNLFVLFVPTKIEAVPTCWK